MQGLAAAATMRRIAVGLMLLAMTGSLVLLLISAVGVVVSLGYTAPPLKLVYRGLGEDAVAQFGTLITVGASSFSPAGSWTSAARASVPIGLLVAMIAFVNEIPDRRSDARAGKRTLPVQSAVSPSCAGSSSRSAPRMPRPWPLCSSGSFRSRPWQSC